MLKLSLFEFFVRGIPEAFLVVLAAHIFSKTTIQKKGYITSSLLLAIIGYAIRCLPIQFGVNTILSLIVLIIIIVLVNKVDIIKSIQACIISMIFQFICEGINVFIIQFILGKDLNSIFNNPTLKTLYGLPSLLIFGCIVLAYYYIFLYRKELKQIADGKVSE